MQPLSYAERTLTHITADGDGVRLHGALSSALMSSTRAEIAAGLIAISAPGPAHVGSDSMNFVRHANDILQQEAIAPLNAAPPAPPCRPAASKQLLRMDPDPWPSAEAGEYEWHLLTGESP